MLDHDWPRERPLIENTATWVDRVRFALADNPTGLDAFEEIIREFRLATDEVTKLWSCPREDCVEKLVEVKCSAGHVSQDL